MIKLFVTITVLYALFVAIYLFILNIAKRKKDIVGKSLSSQEVGQRKTDIVGKSKFNTPLKPTTSNQEPVKASSSESEKQLENPNTFVPPSEVSTSKEQLEVEKEDLDKLFEDSNLEEENELMDINYPLEYEPVEIEEDDEETEEVLGTPQAILASGIRFEDLGNLVQTVQQAETATTEQKLRAGETLLEMQKTDMFEQVVASKPNVKRIVTELMAESLAEFYRRKDVVNIEETTMKAPEDFDIRNFAS